MNEIFTRRECLEKLTNVISDLEVLLAALKEPSNDKIEWYCEAYEDKAQDLTDTLNALKFNYREETVTEFNLGLYNE